jgi:hypothetical protein
MCHYFFHWPWLNLNSNIFSVFIQFLLGEA